MLFSTTTLLLVTCISSTFAAPLPDADDAFNLDRRLPAFGKSSPKKPAPAKPAPVSPPKAPAPPANPKPVTTAKTTTSAATKTTSTILAQSTTTQQTTTSSVTVSSVSSASSTTPSVCSLPKTTVAPPKRFVLRGLNLRDTTEFIGWHGTNSKTADLWTSKGQVVKPTNDDGSVAGKSGLDAELGAGLYLSDTLSVAEAAATINGQNNNLGAKACAIFAKSSTDWRQNVVKARIPESIRGNGGKFEQMRTEYLANLGRTSPTPGPRIGPLDARTNQMLVPENLNPKLQATCFDVVNLTAQNVPATIPAINYLSDDLKAKWEIIKEDENLAKAVKDAINASCK